MPRYSGYSKMSLKLPACPTNSFLFQKRKKNWKKNIKIFTALPEVEKKIYTQHGEVEKLEPSESHWDCDRVWLWWTFSSDGYFLNLTLVPFLLAVIWKYTWKVAHENVVSCITSWYNTNQHNICLLQINNGEN